MKNFRSKAYINEFINYKNAQLDRDLRIREVKNGYILPLKKNKGGVLSSKEDFISESFHDGEWFKVGGKYNFDKANAVYFDDTVIFLGLFIHQWGHFLLDSLSRSWFVSKLKEKKNYKFVFLGKPNKQINGNYLEALKLIGIPSENILIANKVIKAKNIIIPELSTTANHQFSQEYVSIFDTIINNADISKINVPKKVYLSRKLLSLKSEFGEEIIQHNFELNGFKVVFPEKLTLIEQIALFQKSEVIACLNGSIPFNLVFAKPDLQTIIINKCSIPHINIKEIIAVRNIKVVFVDGFYEPVKGFPRNLGDGPFWLTFGKDLQRYFEQKNWKYDKLDISKRQYYWKYIFLCGEYYVKDILREVRNKCYIK